jgi:type IV pilus assembly protein PilM
MGSILESVFARRTDNAIGVDVGTSAVKVVQLDRRGGRPRLRAAGVADLPAGVVENGVCVDSRALADVIGQALSAAGIGRRDAVLAIGVPSLFLREISFPPLSPEELQEAVKWDSEKYVPYSADSYYFDYAVIGQGATDLELKVMLAATPREAIDPLVEAAKGAGLIPVAVDAEPLAVQRTLPAADNVLVVDIGAEISHATIFQRGCPVVTRPVPIGGQRFTEVVMEAFEVDESEAERRKLRQQGLLLAPGAGGQQSPVHSRFELLVTEAAREAMRTIEYYQIQNKEVTIDKVYLTGGGAGLENIAAYFAAQIDRPIIVHDPLAAVDIAGSFDPEYIRGLGGRLGVAVGLALRGGGA